MKAVIKWQGGEHVIEDAALGDSRVEGFLDQLAERKAQGVTLTQEKAMDEVCVWCSGDVSHEPDCPKIAMDSMQSHIEDLESKLDEYEHRAKLHMDRCRHDMERIVALEQQNEALASRLGAVEDELRHSVSVMSIVRSCLLENVRGSTHWENCEREHATCRAISQLGGVVERLSSLDLTAGVVERTVTNEETQ